MVNHGVVDGQLKNSRVVIAGNPKVTADENGFQVSELGRSVPQALRRVLALDQQGFETRVLMILDHEKRVGAQNLLDPRLKGGQRQKRIESPHCSDLHPDIRRRICPLLEEVGFEENRLGFLLEGVVFRIRRDIFGRTRLRNCEQAAATALRLASGYRFDPVQRIMRDTYVASPVEVFFGPEDGMDVGHLVAARKYFSDMGFDPSLIITGAL